MALALIRISQLSMIFSVMVAHKHIVNPKQPPNEVSPDTLVTALVDKIDFTDFTPKPQEGIRISGHVSWVGNSSLEVVVWLELRMHGTWNPVTRALFLLAARDSYNSKSAVVNAVQPANDREIQILFGGEDRKQRWVKLQQKHVLKVIPDSEEQKIIHDIFLRTVNNEISQRNKVLPPGCVWMNSASISNVVFSHPEERNMHNTVFGGFIMAQAEELSWVLGYMFSKYRPCLKSISDIQFQRPIAVSSLIQMHTQVVYTQINYIQILVQVETYNPITGKNDSTNTFHFTYQVPEMVNEVFPMTYHEAMMYIHGRRYFQDVMKKSPGIFSNKL
nr:acyl-coenzyme A thioesterase 10, mitochondrial-like [Leptinotarsa decemlineata]